MFQGNRVQLVYQIFVDQSLMLPGIERLLATFPSRTNFLPIIVRQPFYNCPKAHIVFECINMERGGDDIGSTFRFSLQQFNQDESLTLVASRKRHGV